MVSIEVTLVITVWSHLHSATTLSIKSFHVILLIIHLLLPLVSQVNMASSVWRTWFMRSTQLVRVSESPTTFCYRSSCRWLVTLHGTRQGSSRTWETLDFVAQTSTPSSDNWTEEKRMEDWHWTATSRMLYFLWANASGYEIFNFLSCFFGRVFVIVHFICQPIFWYHLHHSGRHQKDLKLILLPLYMLFCTRVKKYPSSWINTCYTWKDSDSIFEGLSCMQESPVYRHHSLWLHSVVFRCKWQIWFIGWVTIHC